VLSGCDDRKPTGPGHVDWGSDRYTDRIVSHHAWGCLLILPFGSVGIICTHNQPVDISVMAGQLPRVNVAVHIIVGPEPMKGSWWCLEGE
jgi:hypothetical protein